MGRKKNKSTEAAPATTETPVATDQPTTATEDAVGKPVEAGETFSLSETPAADAHAEPGIPDDLPTEWVKPDEVFVEDDARTVPAHNQADLDRDMAVSIFIYGQRQPAVAYRDEIDNRLVIVTGRTRRRAVKLLNEGFETIDPRTNETARFHDAERKLWIAIDKPRGKEEAFVRDLVTQIKVNSLTVVQEAYAVKRLVDKFGWSLTDAAKLFGYNNTNRQNKLVRLLDLEQAVIEKVHAGLLSLDAAIQTANLKPETRLRVIEQASDGEGKVEGSKVKELLRDLYSAGDSDVKQALGEDFGGAPASEGSATGSSEGSEPASGKGGKKKAKGGKKKAGKSSAGPNLNRSVSHFRKFVEEQVEDETTPQPVRDLFKKQLEWFEGRIGDRAFWNTIDSTVKQKYAS